MLRGLCKLCVSAEDVSTFLLRGFESGPDWRQPARPVLRRFHAAGNGGSRLGILDRYARTVMEITSLAGIASLLS